MRGILPFKLSSPIKMYCYNCLYLVTLCKRKMVLLLSMVTSRLILTRRSCLSCLVSSSCWKTSKTENKVNLMTQHKWNPENMTVPLQLKRLMVQLPLKAAMTGEDDCALASRSCAASAFLREPPSPDTKHKVCRLSSIINGSLLSISPNWPCQIKKPLHRCCSIRSV